MEWPTEIHIVYPPWVSSQVPWDRVYSSDEEKMELAIHLSRQNVQYQTGGPFGAAIFEQKRGTLLAVGMNLVVPSHNSVLHGEMVAFMMAQARLRSFTLGAEHLPTYELFSSCEPCAMCLGATLWSGVKRLVCGATKADAEAFQFDEGPVFPESYRYLEDRGILIRKGLLQQKAAEVLKFYSETVGFIYNATPKHVEK
jgi:tRNA(Arg) A34 adenosine deaminase TadA